MVQSYHSIRLPTAPPRIVPKVLREVLTPTPACPTRPDIRNSYLYLCVDLGESQRRLAPNTTPDFPSAEHRRARALPASLGVQTSGLRVRPLSPRWNDAQPR